MFDRFVVAARKVMKLAREESFRCKHPYIGTEHILVGLLLEDAGIAAAVLRQIGLQADVIRKEIKIEPATAHIAVGAIPFTTNAKEALETSVVAASNLRHNYIGTEHLLLGIIANSDSTASQILNKLKLDLEKIKTVTYELIGGTAVTADVEEKQEIVKASKKPYNTPNKKDKSALNQFGRDLTLLAYEDKLDPVIGREDEIERTLLILARRTKNNPILLGEPGVGKTAIVEGIAQRIVSGKVPEMLKNHRLIALDLPAIVAGTKYRGQFEERIKAIMIEAAKEPVVLFIDEIHTMIGAGGAEGAIDAANVLKPALSRGEIRCLGATTTDEYRKSIEKDGALARRFQPITVEPPSVSQSLQILKGLQNKYESFHTVKYDDAALEAAVKLADRYITGRFLPDKAIDVIDEAGARVVMGNLRPKEIINLENQIVELEMNKNSAISEQNFEVAAKHRDALEKCHQQLQLYEKHKTKTKKILRVTKEIVAATVAKITGVPLENITATEADKLLNLEKELGKTVIGQERAKKGLARALRKARAGLKDPKRPIGSFLFLGPTGVGKTLLVKTMAKNLLGSENLLVQLDMSEYMERHNVSRMVGASPGYVGFEEGGQLTEAVRRKPYSVILFDEIEKAHDEVFNILLQILEEGKLTDAQGRVVDFKNTIIVMTSNAGSSVIQNKSPLGFGKNAVNTDDIIEAQINDELQKIFKPEFLNRLDDKIVFTQLTQEDLYQVLALELSKLEKQLAEKHITLELSQEAKEFLLEKGWNPEFGARPLRRAIATFVEDIVADEIIRNPHVYDIVITKKFDEDKLVVQQP
ncbi:ATP-dependent Clp protease ATP-binding subunit [Candidatus Parcubacteria bacterium]|nr:MAG: ATP-dependent Clp protease ATP-binding subunit [Candidatus Parcubacteria bacterium]